MTGRQWDLARITVPAVKRRDCCIWTPPWPLIVQGLAFSRPTRLRQIHIAMDCIATDNRSLVEGYPEYRLELLDGEYTEWRPRGVRPALELLVGSQLSVEFAAAYAEEVWVELLHESIEDYTARLRARATRRERQIGDCIKSLQGPVAPFSELDGVTRDIQSYRGPVPPRKLR